jgi:hypothetical protein
LPPIDGRKILIHLILNSLRGQPKEELVPPIKAEVHMHLTKRHYLIAGGAVLLAAALAVSAATLRNRPEPVTLPEHTAIHVTLDEALASNQNRPGDHFDATVSEPVVIDGKTVIPQGAHAEGLVVDAQQSGRLMGRARLQLALQTVDVNGQDYDVRTISHARIGGNHKKRNWAWIGGGAGGGALIGGLAGGGKGALIGGPVGAGAGATVALLTGKKDIKLRPETPVKFELSEPVTINVKG